MLNRKHEKNKSVFIKQKGKLMTNNAIQLFFFKIRITYSLVKTLSHNYLILNFFYSKKIVFFKIELQILRLCFIFLQQPTKSFNSCRLLR